MEPLEKVLKKEFPELSVDIPSIPGTSDIKPKELSRALQYIRENKLVQDSKNLLENIEPMRSSILYPIMFPNQKRKLNFRVEWVQGPNVYIGCIQSPSNVLHARMYGMNIAE